MAMKKGTGLNQIAQEIFDAHKAQYGVDKKDPTNTVDSIIVKTEKRYWQVHPKSQKSVVSRLWKEFPLEDFWNRRSFKMLKMRQKEIYER